MTRDKELVQIGDGSPPSAGMSVFERIGLDALYEEIQTTYLSDERPWIIGYSGGKDSTTALQLIWDAIARLEPAERSKPIYVIASDTLVETPVIVDYIETTLARINRVARQAGLPFQAHKVTPTVEDSFWVNLIGKGYPAPTSRFRWCTERLKIKPANRFILERASEFGEVVVVLGVRKGESATRDQVMNLHKLPGQRLSRHSSLPNAFVYTPVEEFSVEDVWTYLLQNESPWGNENQELLDLYRSAQAGECPLVIDQSTPSCGNSRFGCWVCTVVTTDHSMESMVDSGEEWLLPLLEFRDFLVETQDPERKLEYRDHRRMDGKVWTKEDGAVVPGPYTMDTCRQFLRRVLEIQEEVRRTGPDPAIQIIQPQELREIRRIWRVERQDWSDSLPRIYREVTGDEGAWETDDTGSFGSQEWAMLQEVCEQRGVSPDLVAKLLDLERNFMGMNRRRAIFSRIDQILREDWRTREAVLAGNGDHGEVAQ
jgi:DNA sulfur modification protein DndC